MKITTQFTLGGVSYNIEVDEKLPMDSLHEAIVLSNPKHTCNLCGAAGYDTKYFTSNKDKEGNTYVNVKCAKCGGRSKLGLYKAGGFFWHEYEKWEAKPKTGDEG